MMGKRVKSNSIENKHTPFIIITLHTSPMCNIAPPNLHTNILDEYESSDLRVQFTVDYSF